MKTSPGHVVAGTRTFHYEIRRTERLLESNNSCLASCCRAEDGTPARAFVVVDRNVNIVYGTSIRAYFADNGIDVRFHELEVSERTKSMPLVLDLARELSEFRLLRRREPLIAIGGGVLLDVCGFAASLYRRGVPYVRVPTTLIGYVDAGIGVKTGVNLDHCKSRLGAYCAPKAVLLDKAFLASLPVRHISNGVAEIVKLALMKSFELFCKLESACPAVLDTKFQSGGLEEEILEQAVTLMLGELSSNFWEDELDRCVDFGHTFSPLFEMSEASQLLHGEAVALDIAISLFLAERRGFMTQEQCKKVLSLLVVSGLLERRVVLNPQSLASALAEAAIHRDGSQRLPLPMGIGDHTFVQDVTQSEIATAVARLSSALVWTSHSNCHFAPAYLPQDSTR